ncbi:MAG: rRNA cytosine-C5-methyltransferase [Parabacteroides sp.]
MTLPTDFVTRTQALLGETYPLFEAALQKTPSVSLRINKAKGTTIPQKANPVAWCKTGFYLPERLTFTFDPLFHSGAYYVQEASSMFLEQAIQTYVKEPVCCLDLCAAPGGKSTLLASCLPEGSLLVSNEVIRSRSYILAENLTKWGDPNCVVLNNDPVTIGETLPHFFDVIVTDVPCSGEGMFRKDSESTQEWSIEHVQLCATRSRRIIHDIWKALKPGGLLIYSTCTYNTEENEENIHYFVEELDAEPLAIPISEAWQICGSLRYSYPVYRFFPHRVPGEGFFLAALRKKEGTIISSNKTKRKKEKKVTPAIPSHIIQFLKEPQQYQFVWKENKLIAYPKVIEEPISQLINSHLRLLSTGILIGELKGKDFIPAEELALSTALNPVAFPKIELTWEESISYLRKEAIILPTETPRSNVIVCFHGYPLGFVKHLGNRSNNLYPAEWRIRSSYSPEVVKLFSISEHQIK